jgi:hypothetical protein
MGNSNRKIKADSQSSRRQVRKPEFEDALEMLKDYQESEQRHEVRIKTQLQDSEKLEQSKIKLDALIAKIKDYDPKAGPKALMNIFSSDELELLNLEGLKNLKSADQFMTHPVIVLLHSGHHDLIQEFLRYKLKSVNVFNESDQQDNEMEDIFLYLAIIVLYEIPTITTQDVVTFYVEFFSQLDAQYKMKKFKMSFPEEFADESKPNIDSKKWDELHNYLMKLIYGAMGHLPQFLEVVKTDVFKDEKVFLLMPCGKVASHELVCERVSKCVEAIFLSPCYTVDMKTIFQSGAMNGLLPLIVNNQRDLLFDQICHLIEMQFKLYDSTGHKELRQHLKSLLLYVCDRKYISGFHKMTDKFNFSNQEITDIYHQVPFVIKEEIETKYGQYIEFKHFNLALSPP